MKWALFVFAFVAPLLVSGIFLVIKLLKNKEGEFSFKNPIVKDEVWNYGLSVLLSIAAGIVGVFSSDVFALNLFVGYVFVSLLAREITPLIKLNYKKFDRKAITPIIRALIALLGFIFEVTLFQTWPIFLLSGMRLGAFALLAYLAGNVTKSFYENKDLSIVRIAFVFFFIVFLFYVSANPHAYCDVYPFNNDASEYFNENPYLYYNQFDAFMHGQIHLLDEPDLRLSTLENPYDPYQRIGIPYLWDTVYFDGHYYSYYGVAPIFFVMFPFYILSGFTLVPNGLFTLVLSTILYAYGIFRLSIVLKERYAANVPSWFLYIFSFFVFVSSLGFNFISFRWTDWKYRVPFAYAVVGLTFFLTYFFEGLKRSGIKQHIYWALSSIFYVLIMGSRPELGIMAIVIIPFIVKYLLEGRTELVKGEKKNLFPLISFAVPLVVGGIALAGYNYLRFGSFLEFGSNYQLTINDPRTNALNSESYFNAFYHYFWQQPIFSSSLQEAGFAGFFTRDKFPTITTERVLLAHETHVYIQDSVGVLANPMVYLALLLPVGLIANKKVEDWTYLIVPPFLLLILSWLMYCLGGVCMRYILYFWPLAGIWVLSIFYSSYSTLGKEKGTKVPLMIVSLALTFLGAYLAYNLCKNPFDGWQLA